MCSREGLEEESGMLNWDAVWNEWMTFIKHWTFEKRWIFSRENLRDAVFRDKVHCRKTTELINLLLFK